MKFREFESEQEKEYYLKWHYFREPLPHMNDEMMCRKCNTRFLVKDFKVFITTCDCCDEYIEVIVCPNFINCEGDFMDWAGIECLN